MDSHFNLNDVKLLILAENEDLLIPLLPYIGAFRSDKTVLPDFTMTLERAGEHQAPDDLEPLSEGTLAEGHPSRLGIDADTLWLNVSGKASLELSTKRRYGRLSVQAGSEPLIGGTFGLYALELILASAKQTLLHSAALKLPEQECAIMLFAPSGTGKTTTALALALQGFGLLTDDATVLIQPEDRISHRVWGLPRALKVHRRTRDLLPQLSPLLTENWNREDEQVLMQSSLASIAPVCPPWPYPLAAVVALAPRVTGAHSIRPIEKTEILLRLAEDNMCRSSRGVLSDQLIRFAGVAAAISSTPTFELGVGSDLASLGHDLLAALTPATAMTCPN